MPEERDNSGVLFVNDRKQGDRHPDWKGRGIVNGQPVWISMWEKQGRNGTFYSLSFQPREERPQQPPVDDPFE